MGVGEVVRWTLIFSLSTGVLGLDLGWGRTETGRGRNAHAYTWDGRAFPFFFPIRHDLRVGEEYDTDTDTWSVLLILYNVEFLLETLMRT